MLSLFIPAYNEGSVLDQSVSRVVDALSGVAFELFIIDDASTDSTPDIGRRLEREDKRIRYVRYDFGPTRRENLADSFRIASGDVVGFIDADLSASPEIIPRMLQLLSDYDIVIGSRRMAGAVVTRSLWRRVFTSSANLFLRVFFKSALSDHQCGLKLFRRNTLLELVSQAGYDRSLRRGFSWDTEILLRAEWRGLRICEVPVSWSDSGRSSVDVRRDWRMIPYIFGLRQRL